MNKLKDLKITAVALCKQGANPDAHIMLYKSIDPKGGNTMKTFEEILKSLPQEEQDTVNAELEKAKTANKPDGDMEDLMDGGADEATEDVKGAKGNKPAKNLVKSLREQVAELKKSKVTKSKEEEEEELMKSLPEGLKASYVAMKKSAEAAALVAKTLQDEKITKQYIEKANVLKSLPAKPEELGDMLKSIAKYDQALCDKVEKFLTATNTIVEKGSMFKEIGDGRTESQVEALAQLEKCVGEIVAKSKGLTKEQAYAKALDEHPELYAAYLKSLEDNE